MVTAKPASKKSTPKKSAGKHAKRQKSGSTAKKTNGKKKQNSQAQNLVGQIQEVQKRERTARADLVRCVVEIGGLLLQLKDEVGHGHWRKALKDLGYNARAAQYRMKVARSDWAEQIRTKGSDLAEWLPTDVQKLAILTELSVEQVQQARQAGWNCDDLNRGQLRQAVNALLHPDADRNLEASGLADQAPEGAEDTDDSDASGRHGSQQPKNGEPPNDSVEEQPSDGHGGSSPTMSGPGRDTNAAADTDEAAFEQLLQCCRRINDLADIAAEEVSQGEIASLDADEARETITQTQFALKEMVPFLSS